MAASGNSDRRTLLETVYREAVIRGLIEPENLVDYLKGHFSPEIGIDSSTGEATFISMKFFRDFYTSSHKHLPFNSGKPEGKSSNGVSVKLIINILQKKADPRTTEEMLFCLCCRSFLSPPIVLHPCGHLACGSCYVGPNSYDGRDTCRIHKCTECECDGVDEKAAETIEQTKMMRKYSQVQEWIRGLQKFQHDPTIGPLIARHTAFGRSETEQNTDSGFEDGSAGDTSPSSEKPSSCNTPSHPSSSKNSMVDISSESSLNHDSGSSFAPTLSSRSSSSKSDDSNKNAINHKRGRTPSPVGLSIDISKHQRKKRKVTFNTPVVSIFKPPQHNVFHGHGPHNIIKLGSEIIENELPMSDASDNSTFCKGPNDHFTTDDGICMAYGDIVEEKITEPDP